MRAQVELCWDMAVAQILVGTSSDPKDHDELAAMVHTGLVMSFLLGNYLRRQLLGDFARMFLGDGRHIKLSDE
jgi:hypothetical protein